MAAGEYVSVRAHGECTSIRSGWSGPSLPSIRGGSRGAGFDLCGARDERGEAHALAQRTIANPESPWTRCAREELGLNPQELGSPWGAALSSFFFFSVRRARAAARLRSLVATAPLSRRSHSPHRFVRGRLDDQPVHGPQRGARRLAHARDSGSAGAVTYLVGMLLGVSLT